MAKPLMTLVTPTGDRPEAFALCEKWIGNQTFKDFKWVVVDDGLHETRINLADTVIRPQPRREGENSQGRNLQAALSQVDTRYVAFIEDDDYYRRDYLEKMIDTLEQDDLDGVGENQAFFYNINDRKYKIVRNYRHAALCQTVIRKEVLPYVLKVIKDDKFLYDIALWSMMEKFNFKTKLFPGSRMVVGIKGMPGRKGIGRGHTDTTDWEMDDKNFSVLISMLGDDARSYMFLMQ